MITLTPNLPLFDSELLNFCLFQFWSLATAFRAIPFGFRFGLDLAGLNSHEFSFLRFLLRTVHLSFIFEAIAHMTRPDTLGRHGLLVHEMNQFTNHHPIGAFLKE